MRFFLYNSIAIKPWGPQDLETGIGGIETALGEMAWRLVRLGNEVTIFTDLKDESPKLWRGVKWRHYKDADLTERGLWVVYRSFEIIPFINKDSNIWFVAQDWDYRWEDDWVECVDRIMVLCETHRRYILQRNPQLEQQMVLTSHGVKVDLIEEIEKQSAYRYCFDWWGTLENNPSIQQFAKDVFAAGHEVFILSSLPQGTDFPYEEHLDRLGIPYNKVYRVQEAAPRQTAFNKLKILRPLKPRIFFDDVMTNVELAQKHGIRSVLVDRTLNFREPIPNAERIGRRPRRIMYASSPDRGLYTLLTMMPKIREVIPDAELHIFYGFNGIDELIEKGQWPEKARMATEDLRHLVMETEGVVWRGRVSQRQLYEEWMSAGLMVYPTMFAELTFIAGQESQCCGAIPVVTNVWAQGENAGHGIRINGNPETSLVKAHFVAEICALMKDVNQQEELRFRVIQESRPRCNWDKHADQWDILSNTEAVVRKNWKCRGCGSISLRPVFDMGIQHVATFFPPPGTDVAKAPLTVMECQSCFLSQLSHTVSREYLFRGEYGYRSGINEEMKDHLKRVASFIHTDPADIVVDIGCNDGTLLGFVEGRRVGFEPNQCCPSSGDDNNIYLNEFFSAKRYFSDRRIGGKKASVVFSLAMLYDMENPAAFAKEVWEVLKPNGIWCIEVQDAEKLFNKGAYDFICHEHLTNWTYHHLRYFLDQNGFYVTSADYNEINGGSMLVVAQKVNSSPYNPRPYPERTLDWSAFASGAVEHRDKLQELIKGLNTDRIMGYGASTKGNVLLQYCGIKREQVGYIADRNPSKWGRTTPGTGISIINEETMRDCHPEYLLALPWAFIDGFRKREPDQKFIVPFPEPRVMESYNDEQKTVKEIIEVAHAGN